VENGILLKDAEEAFHQIFDTTYNYPYKKKFTTALLEAFKKAFIELDEYHPPKKLSTPQANKIEKYKNYLQSILLPNNESTAQKNPPKTPSARENKLHLEQPQKRDDIVDKIKPDQSSQTLSPQNNEQNNIDHEKWLELQKNKLRRVWCGELYKPAITKVFDQSDDCEIQWLINTPCKTKDFLTLIRKSAIVILANHGFLVRETFLNDGEKIALVLTLPDENIKKTALQMGLYRPVDFGMADILSLEPADQKYRPLRVNQHLVDEYLWEKTYAATRSPEDQTKIKAIRKKIINLLSFS
jgi:hypothetical protein